MMARQQGKNSFLMKLPDTHSDRHIGRHEIRNQFGNDFQESWVKLVSLGDRMCDG
jgi:hypothetical protein